MARWLHENLDHEFLPPSRGFVRMMMQMLGSGGMISEKQKAYLESLFSSLAMRRCDHGFATGLSFATCNSSSRGFSRF